MFMKVVFAFGMVLGMFTASFAITEDQMRKSTDMVRSVCQPKNKVSDELVNGISKGVFPEDKGLKCYTQCVMEMMGIMKKAKIMYDAAVKQFDLLLPDDYKDPYKNALTTCKDVVKGIKDLCEAAYAVVQCFYKNNEKFLFP